MRLSISNIAWDASQDKQMYQVLNEYGFGGLEIAPTRIFPEMPYDRLEEATEWAEELKKSNLIISSMQSIWFGRQEKVFGSEKERQVLIDYTKKAIDFAVAIGCNNLVFGCPRNRVLPDGVDEKSAYLFFKELGDYAYEKGTVIGMEANPPMYNTNYINDTESALALIKVVDSKGFKLNLDVGTMIVNEESVNVLRDNVSRINHVHISEPGLKPIEKRKLHTDLYEVLNEEGYAGFVSIEMGKVEDIEVIKQAMSYVKSIYKSEC